MRRRFAGALVQALLLSAATLRAQGPHCPPPAPDVEPNDTLALASPIALPPFGNALAIPSNGTIDPAGDVDHFRINLQAGQRLSILVDTSVPTIGSRDSFVRVRASDGTVLAQDDDDGTALDLSTWTVVSQDASAIAGLAVSASGDYFIEVTAANPGDRMSYRMYTAVSAGASAAEIEPNDAFPIQPMQDETILGQHRSRGRRPLRGARARQRPTDGADGRSGRSGFGGRPDPALRLVPVRGGGLVELGGRRGRHAAGVREHRPRDGVAARPGTSPYRLGVFYLGDTCGLPVTLETFAVE